MVVEFRGDEALAAFDSLRRAIRAATDLQARFEAETFGEAQGVPLPVGIGLDVGEAVAVEDRYRGNALNIAARTEKGKEMAELFGGVLGIPFHHGENGLWVFQLADGSKVEVFGSKSHNPHFTTGPVPGFLTDNVDAATEELRAIGIPIVSGPIRWDGEDDVAWVHFRAPDGNIYELTQGRDLEL